MIGIFDSGVGGFCAFEHLRGLLPDEDIVYLADGENSPYGTKSADEIKEITEKNIRRLRGAGADIVLIACCTASSLHHRLSESDRRISIPIIQPSARLAAMGGKNIAVIATRHTASTHAFASEIKKYSDAPVSEYAEQELVALIEGGNRWGRIDKKCAEYLKAVAEKIKRGGADTLILGCTHFSHLLGEIERLLPKVRVISPAHVGAEEAARAVTNLKKRRGDSCPKKRKDI